MTNAEGFYQAVEGGVGRCLSPVCFAVAVAGEYSSFAAQALPPHRFSRHPAGVALRPNSALWAATKALWCVCRGRQLPQ